jgi:hypothetical protein
MPANTQVVLRSTIASTDPTLATYPRDPLIYGDNGGVRFVADLGFGLSYPGGLAASRPAPAAPVNGAVVYDVAKRANARAVVATGQTVGYAGGGFDFSALTNEGSYLEVPAAVAADIATAVGGKKQRFLVCLYVRLPTLAQWSNEGVPAPFLCHTLAQDGYAAEADLVMVGQLGTGRIRSRRQTAGAGSATEEIIVDVPAAAAGTVAQVAYWRDDAGQALRVRTVAGTVIGTAALGADNTGDFSAKKGVVGVGPSHWAYFNGFIGTHATAKNWRLFRCWYENLARSLRDPVEVLDADYERVIARGVFS